MGDLDLRVVFVYSVNCVYGSGLFLPKEMLLGTINVSVDLRNSNSVGFSRVVALFVGGFKAASFHFISVLDPPGTATVRLVSRNDIILFRLSYWPTAGSSTLTSRAESRVASSLSNVSSGGPSEDLAKDGLKNLLW